MKNLRSVEKPKTPNPRTELITAKNQMRSILARDLREKSYQMKAITKKIIVLGIIVLLIVSIVAGVLGGHL